MVEGGTKVVVGSGIVVVGATVVPGSPVGVVPGV